MLVLVTVHTKFWLVDGRRNPNVTWHRCTMSVPDMASLSYRQVEQLTWLPSGPATIGRTSARSLVITSRPLTDTSLSNGRTCNTIISLQPQLGKVERQPGGPRRTWRDSCPPRRRDLTKMSPPSSCARTMWTPARACVVALQKESFRPRHARNILRQHLTKMLKF